MPRKARKEPSITATIRLEDAGKFIQLLCAFYAVHNHASHDEDDLVLDRPDGSRLILRASVSYLEWCRPGEEHGPWTENIDLGLIEQAVRLFIAGDDQRLAEFPWLTPP